MAIERAMHKNYDADPKKRNLQQEAEAHVAVQRWIDAGNLMGRSTTVESIREVHQRFCAALPEELLWVEIPDTKERVKVVPGEFREHFVEVGDHVPISPGAVPRFVKRFKSVYSGLGRAEAVASAAAAHHRLLWIHPIPRWQRPSCSVDVRCMRPCWRCLIREQFGQWPGDLAGMLPSISSILQRATLGAATTLMGEET